MTPTLYGDIVWWLGTTTMSIIGLICLAISFGLMLSVVRSTLDVVCIRIRGWQMRADWQDLECSLIEAWWYSFRHGRWSDLRTDVLQRRASHALRKF